MRFIVALTGASGAVYALRLLEQLVAARHRVDVVLSEPACVSMAAETEIKLNAHHLDLEKLCPGASEFLTAHNPRDIGASIASGSVRHDGMIVVPCSMGTLGRIAHGLSDDLISRAADVTLKERRKLILVTREMPLSLVHLKNMVAVTEAGAQVLEYNVRFGDPETQSILIRLESDFVDVCQAIVDGKLGETEVKFSDESSACVVLASRGYPAKAEIGDVISGLRNAESHENAVVFHAGTAKNESGEFVTAGGRVLGVTATGKDLENALQNAYSAVNEISWNGMQYRRDIGK